MTSRSNRQVTTEEAKAQQKKQLGRRPAMYSRRFDAMRWESECQGRREEKGRGKRADDDGKGKKDEAEVFAERDDNVGCERSQRDGVAV